jgi:hypothetical protein
VKEAQFTYELLGAGATQIRRADYATKGIYFQAFTSLSTGLERIGKLALMLDHYITTKGAFPDLKYLKVNIGHKISLIYAKSIDVVRNRKIPLHFLSNLDDPLHQAILKILSDFAEGDRYSNIDLLVGNPRARDPVAAWFRNVDLQIFEARVSERRKRQISENAHIIDSIVGDMSYVQHTSETGSGITNIEEASYRTGLQNAVSPHRQLLVLQIIRFWAELVDHLQHGAMQVDENEDIPYLNEIFAPFVNADTYMKTRKTWDKL